MKNILLSILILALFCSCGVSVSAMNETGAVQETAPGGTEFTASAQQETSENNTIEETTQDIAGDTYEQLLEQSGADQLLDNLSPEVKESLKALGITGANADELANVSFSSIINEILKQFSNQSRTPMKTCLAILVIMILYAVLDCFKDSLGEAATKQVLDIVTTLCITCALVMPVSEVITLACNTIQNAANFMLAYIPVMVVIMIASGQAASGSSYYSTMIMAGQGVSQVSSKIIAPMLNVFLGISVTGTIAPNINLSGITELASKVVKWLLAFVMTVFTAVLSFRSMISTAADNVSTRAVRFTLSSFIPVVGSALADAYKTVQSSITLLKSGIGVLVIFSVAVIFLPVIAQCLIWLISINISKGIGEILNQQQPCKLLEAVNAVISILLAIVLCIMAIFIISTAVVLLLGGAPA